MPLSYTIYDANRYMNIIFTSPQEKIKQRNKRYREKNKEKLKEHKKIYYEQNKEKLKNSKYLYAKNKRQTDIQYRLCCNLRRRLRNALKKNAKSGSAVRDLGCSIEQLKQHLESKFQTNMSWNNYGPTGWHIDHIIPLSKFNLSIREELLKACHYTNLQPLWAIDNICKGNKLYIQNRQ